MKSFRYFSIALVSIVALSTSLSIGAHGGGYRWGIGVPFYYGHPGYGIYLGAPLYGPYDYPPYSYSPYYLPPAAPPLPPPSYFGPETAPQYNPRDNWYFCSNPRGYYPQIPSCPGGWQTLEPQPRGEAPGYWYYCNNPAGYYPYVLNCLEPWQQIIPGE